jgi:hypothetical protein
MYKKVLEKECLKSGIIPVFKGDYISLDSFPHRNIIKEKIIGEVFRDGVKTIEKKHTLISLNTLLGSRIALP